MNTTRFSMRALHATRPFRTPALSSRSPSCARLFHACSSRSVESKPGGGNIADDVADMEKTAFDPKSTDPQTQAKDAAKEKGSEKDSPLNMSSANPETRDWEANNKGSGSSSRQDVSSSGGGSPNKAGGGAGKTNPASGSRADE